MQRLEIGKIYILLDSSYAVNPIEYWNVQTAEDAYSISRKRIKEYVYMNKGNTFLVLDWKVCPYTPGYYFSKVLYDGHLGVIVQNTHTAFDFNRFGEVLCNKD